MVSRTMHTGCPASKILQTKVKSDMIPLPRPMESRASHPGGPRPLKGVTPTERADR